MLVAKAQRKNPFLFSFIKYLTAAVLICVVLANPSENQHLRHVKNESRIQFEGLIKFKQNLPNRQNNIIHEGFGKRVRNLGLNGQKVLNMDRETFMLLAIIGIVIIFFVAIGCCVVCCIRCMRKKKSICEYDSLRKKQLKKCMIYCPSVSYQLFCQLLAIPIQRECCVCLEEFEKKGKRFSLSQKNETYNMVNEDRNYAMKRYSQKNIKKQPIMIKMIICGHILHEKCLQQWLLKQSKCPSCHETFSNQNLQKHEKQIGISLKQIYHNYLTSSLSSYRKQNTIKRPNLGASFVSQQMMIQNQDMVSLTFQQIMEEKKIILSKEDIYAIDLYSRIMNRKNKKHNKHYLETEPTSKQFEYTIRRKSDSIYKFNQTAQNLFEHSVILEDEPIVEQQTKVKETQLKQVQQQIEQIKQNVVNRNTKQTASSDI